MRFVFEQTSRRPENKNYRSNSLFPGAPEISVISFVGRHVAHTLAKVHNSIERNFFPIPSSAHTRISPSTYAQTRVYRQTIVATHNTYVERRGCAYAITRQVRFCDFSATFTIKGVTMHRTTRRRFRRGPSWRVQPANGVRANNAFNHKYVGYRRTNRAQQCARVYEVCHHVKSRGTGWTRRGKSVVGLDCRTRDLETLDEEVGDNKCV